MEWKKNINSLESLLEAGKIRVALITETKLNEKQQKISKDTNA